MMVKMDNARYPDVDTAAGIARNHGTDAKQFNPPNDGWDKEKLKKEQVDSKQFN